MARPLLLLCAAFALLLPWIPSDSARCSRPKDVANAFIDAGDNTVINTFLRYTCKPGYKRKAGTSTLIQCIYQNNEAVWTDSNLQCIRDPALPLQTPSPELPTTRTTQRQTTSASPTSSPTPAATLVMDGSSTEMSMPPAMPKPRETPASGEEAAQGTTPLPTSPKDHAAAVSTQTLASSIGLALLLVAGVVGFCCWRMKMRVRQDYVVAVTAIPMVAPTTTAGNDEMLPPSDFPTG